MSRKGGAPENLKRDGNPGHVGAGGRPPDWLKAKCKKIVEDKKLIEFLADVANGEKINKTDIFDLDNQKIGHSESSAAPKDRIKAVEILLERGFGKSEQPISQPLDDKGKTIPYSIVVKSVTIDTNSQMV